MATENFFRKERVVPLNGGFPFDALVPTTEAGEQWLAELPQGEVLKGTFSRPRNIKHHRKFYALLNLIFKNQTHYKSVDDLLLAFKYHVGHGHWVVTKTLPGQAMDVVQIFQPHSISFAKMDQAAFSEFYDKALDFVLTVVIPGLDREDLERELREFAE